MARDVDTARDSFSICVGDQPSPTSAATPARRQGLPPGQVVRGRTSSENPVLAGPRDPTPAIRIIRATPVGGICQSLLMV
jgi:hypothetical protein